MNLDAVRPPRWLRWTAVVLVAAVVTYESLFDSPAGAGIPPMGPLGLVGFDKWLHALGYAGLAGTLAVALAHDRETVIAAALAVVIAVLYGIGIEFAQAPLPARDFSVGDMAADAVGAIIAVLVWRAGLAVVNRSVAGKPTRTRG